MKSGFERLVLGTGPEAVTVPTEKVREVAATLGLHVVNAEPEGDSSLLMLCEYVPLKLKYEPGIVERFGNWLSGEARYFGASVPMRGEFIVFPAEAGLAIEWLPTWVTAKQAMWTPYLCHGEEGVDGVTARISFLNCAVCEALGLGPVTIDR